MRGLRDYTGSENIGMRMRDGVGETSAAEAPHEEEAEAKTMNEDEEDEGGGRPVRKVRMWMMRKGARRARAIAAQGPCRKALTLPIATLIDATAEDGSFGELSISENSEGEGEGEAGHPQALPSSLLHKQKSLGKLPEVVGQTVPSKTASTAGDLPPAGSQDAVVVHTTEPELRSIK